MSEKVVPTLGSVSEKKMTVVGVYRDTVEKKTRKTRQPVTVESLLASIRALDGLVPSNSEDDDVEARLMGDVVIGHRVDLRGGTSVSVTCGHYQTEAPTLKAALQAVVAHLDERAQAERARMTEFLDAVLRQHGAKRRKGAL